MKFWLIAGIIIGIVILGVGWILVSPLFIDKVVSEELPVNVEVIREAAPSESEIISDDSESTSSAVMSYTGSFVDADSFHKASGKAMVISSDGQTFLRFEGFATTNGPDLKIYLATDTSASDFIDLGRLKGNKGNQNYEVPGGTDLEKYDTVLIWCRAFSVLFGSAELQ